MLIHAIMLNNSANCSMLQSQGLRRCVEEIVFSYTYPRLDMEVIHNLYVFAAVKLSKVILAPNQLYTHDRYQST